MSFRYGVDDLLEKAADAGYPLTRHQLKRLRHNGLISTPPQEHPTGVSGSGSAYSDEHLEQLLGVLRLKHDQGHTTFQDLRVGAWLSGHEVDFQHLRPDVVDSLRSSIEGHQNLEPGKEDDQVSERLKKAFSEIPKRDLSAVDQLLTGDSSGAISFEDVTLPMLQLMIRTPQSNLSRDRFAHQVRLVNESDERVSDLYEDWGMPSTSGWPRIVSRSGRGAFDFGRAWLVAFRDLVTETDVYQTLAGSPLTLEILDRFQAVLVDESPSTLERRTYIACQGIVLIRSNPMRLKELLFSDN